MAIKRQILCTGSSGRGAATGTSTTISPAVAARIRAVRFSRPQADAAFHGGLDVSAVTLRDVYARPGADVCFRPQVVVVVVPLGPRNSRDSGCREDNVVSTTDEKLSLNYGLGVQGKDPFG